MKAQKFGPMLLVAVAGLLAYSNSFTGGFLDDDLGSIPENRTIRHLWPIWEPLSPPHQTWLTVVGRPLINLSLAINYAIGGYNVWGYHALNLTVHILAALTLLGIVRRTLLQPPLRGRFGAAANELALATALLWMLHPVQTESVTYMIQRAESIMGLLYLLTLYCFIRGAESGPVGNGKWSMGNGPWKQASRVWYGLSVAACALGMASKEVMVTAPVMVLLYDRAFVSDSFRDAWHRRWPLYLALGTTWGVLVFVEVWGDVSAHASSTAHAVGRWHYLATEPGAILYYLRLSVWPSPLCLDRPWPIATTWMRILPPTVGLLILIGAVVWAWIMRPAWGFAGAWFLLILAPSSSFVPLPDAMYEHRMYLSLVAVVSLVVLGLYSWMGRQSLPLFVATAVGLGFLTWRRNLDYRNELTLRFDTVAKFPNDPVVQYNLGVTLGKQGRAREAIGHFEQALWLMPNSAEVHDGLAEALQQSGRFKEAIGQYEQALRIKPDDPVAHNELGIALAQVGALDQAINHFEQALRIKPDFAEACNNLGLVLSQAGKLPEAISRYEQALRFRPDYAEAHNNLGNAFRDTGRLPEAIQHFEQALRINPDYVVAHGRLAEAQGQYTQALQLAPGFAEARKALARLQAAK